MIVSLPCFFPPDSESSFIDFIGVNKTAESALNSMYSLFGRRSIIRTAPVRTMATFPRRC